MVNRYRLSASMGRGGFSLVDVNEDPSNEDQAHPLVPLGEIRQAHLGPINSQSDALVNGRQVTSWPILNKNNSRYLYRQTHTHVPDVVFKPMLGEEVYERNKGRVGGNIFVARGTTSRVRVGPWTFHASDLEDDKRLSYVSVGTCHSFFAIRNKWVPQMLGTGLLAFPGWTPESLLYGKFHRFVQLDTPRWLPGDQRHYVGQCTLWNPEWDDMENCGLDVIHLDEPLEYFDDKRIKRKLEWVPLDRIETMCMVGPKVKGWKRRRGGEQPDLVTGFEFYVMPLQL